MPSKKEATPTPATAQVFEAAPAQVEVVDVTPELTVVHKFNIRDLQLKSQTAHVNAQTWTENAKTACASRSSTRSRHRTGSARPVIDTTQSLPPAALDAHFTKSPAALDFSRAAQ